MRRYHPDAGGDPAGEEIRSINGAFRVVSSYCAGYRFSFSEEEFLEQNPDERLRRQFQDAPLWGAR